MPLSLHMLDPLKAAKRGYAVVIQDTRGRYTSEGKFYAFKDDIHDGYDTVEWVASQPCRSGRWGCMAAPTSAPPSGKRPRRARHISPPSLPSHGLQLPRRVTYQGGAFALGFNVSWTLGNLTLANFQSLAARKQIPRAQGAAGPGG